jgi:hypothetical protein
MLKDAIKTIGNLIDKQGVSFISSVGTTDSLYKSNAASEKARRIKTFYLRQTPYMRVSHYLKTIKPASTFAINVFSEELCLKGLWNRLKMQKVKK